MAYLKGGAPQPIPDACPDRISYPKALDSGPVYYRADGEVDLHTATLQSDAPIPAPRTPDEMTEDACLRVEK